jgi:16S rRNA (guanine966-N2)-methyltransferase
LGPVLAALARGAHLTPDALLVAETAARDPALRVPDGLEACDQRRYGDTRIDFLRLSPPGGAPREY